MSSLWLGEQANIHLQLSHLPVAALDSPAGVEAQPHLERKKKGQKKLKYSCNWFNIKAKRKVACTHAVLVDEPLACLVLHVWLQNLPTTSSRRWWFGSKKTLKKQSTRMRMLLLFEQCGDVNIVWIFVGKSQNSVTLFHCSCLHY